MKKVLIIAVALLVLAFVPVAEAKPNYKPYKQALYRAWQFYGEEMWLPRSQEGEGISCPMGWGNSRTNEWGERTRMMCSLVTSLYGVFPQDGVNWDSHARYLPLNQETKDFLTPFIHASDETLLLLYHPPILDLREAL